MDLIEVNHFHDAEKIRFSQMIYWSMIRGELHVRTWRVIDNDYYVPRDAAGYCDIVIRDGVTYRIRSKSYRETWTDYDPEVVDRRVWPEEFRQWIY